MHSEVTDNLLRTRVMWATFIASTFFWGTVAWLFTGCTSTSAQVERAAAGCLCAAQKCEAVVSASGQATANADVMLRQLNGKPK